MIHRFAFAIVSPIGLAACGTPPGEQSVDPASTQEAQALEDAASMLDENESPPSEAQSEDNQISGDQR